MDTSISRCLDQFGLAQVMVVWQETVAAAETAPSEHSLFVSQATDGCALTDASGARFFRNLMVSVGCVDAGGARQMLQTSNVGGLYAAEQMSLIHPVTISEAGPTDLGGAEHRAWGLERVGVQQLWDMGLTGEGVLVGHLDTGVDAQHVALQERIVAFREFDYSGNPVESSAPHDTGIHGTHTAGTICGGAVSGLHIGMAPGARLCTGLVIEGGNALLRILAGLDWLVSQPVRVLNMSLGVRGYNPFFVEITRRIRQRNILPVIAIGNEGQNSSRSPGNYEDALSVGALDQDGRVAAYSSSMEFPRDKDRVQPDVVAPGSEIVSAKPGGGIQVLSGSSMATPHVTGLAALLIQAKPEATVDEIEYAIRSTCIPISGGESLRCGSGVISPVDAVRALAT